MTLNESLLQEWGEYITTNPGTSFVELERIAGKHIEVAGDQGIFFALDGLAEGEESNALMWAGVSIEFHHHIQELLHRGFRVRSTQLLVYMMDGKVLDLPLWKPRGKAAKNPAKVRWLPVSFSPGTSKAV